jgi:transposase InsO family protein
MSIRTRAPEFAELSVERLCRAAGVCRSQYYLESKVLAEPPELCLIRELQERFPRYGYRRVAAHLGMAQKRVRSLMRRHVMGAKRPSKTPRLPVRFAGGANLVKDKRPEREGQILAFDVTAVRLYGSRWAYFAAALDMFTRELVGYAVSGRNDTELVRQALESAVLNSNLQPGWMHHSDRGASYTSHAYLAHIESLKGIASFSDPGRPTQNAFIESFFKSFKAEEGGLDIYTDLEDAKRAVTAYVALYNTERIHSSIGMKPPSTFRQENNDKHQPS